MKIILFGPGPMFKGGISNYNVSLARTLDRLGADVQIVSWTQQYPAIIPRDFIDRNSKVDLLAGTNVKVKYITNYNNPFTWTETANYILAEDPDILLIQWTITLQGLPIGCFLKKIRAKSRVEVIFDLHNVSQKENSVLDKRFSRYALKQADTFLAHSYSMADELKELLHDCRFVLNETGERWSPPAPPLSGGETVRNSPPGPPLSGGETVRNSPPSPPLTGGDITAPSALNGNVSPPDKGGMGGDNSTKTIIKLYHPVYDIFEPKTDFDRNAEKAKLNLRPFVFLFFGFIRKYKGLHNIIPAFAKVAAQRDDVSLLVAGESFWQTLDQTKLSTRIKKAVFATAKSIFLKKGENEQDYRPLELIKELGIEDRVTVVNQFIPNEDVGRYFQVSDALVLYYTTSVPSGVESIAYNFGLPILATKLGHFPETIKPGYNGYLADPDNIDDMAAQMLRAIENPIEPANVFATGERFSWDNYAKAILKGGKR